MQTVTTSVPPDVRDILARSAIDGRALTLPDQLDRPTYLRVDKILRAAGAKWDRRARAHLFPFDPRQLLADAVGSGAVVDRTRTLQFFETPPALAARMVDLARIRPGQAALEPSAGQGRIVLSLLAAGARVRAVEPDARNCDVLRASTEADVWQGAFQAFAADSRQRFDAVVMNPPFSGGQDTAHIRLAWDQLAEGGRLVAVCSEGPFFRQTKRDAAFRAWLQAIDAHVEALASDSFKVSGTGVQTRLIVATRPGAQPEEHDDGRGQVQVLPLDKVHADPGQPRKVFEPALLGELAASIRADGLLQPITVRVAGDGWMIVAGERRFLASLQNGARTIRALVIEPRDQADVRVKQIVENDQRVDVTPLEQARSYQGLMQEAGWSVEQLAARIGKQPFRINERLVLLRLSADYQALLASGNLKPSEAWEMARLSPRSQDVLFRAIRGGRCKTSGDLRVMANALHAAEQQTSILGDDPAAPTEAEHAEGSAFERNVERVAALLRSGITDNQVTALRRVNPHRAGTLADVMAVMQTDLRRIELALRQAAIQHDLLADAGG